MTYEELLRAAECMGGSLDVIECDDLDILGNVRPQYILWILDGIEYGHTFIQNIPGEGVFTVSAHVHDGYAEDGVYNGSTEDVRFFPIAEFPALLRQLEEMAAVCKGKHQDRVKLYAQGYTRVLERLDIAGWDAEVSNEHIRIKHRASGCRAKLAAYVKVRLGVEPGHMRVHTSRTRFVVPTGNLIEALKATVEYHQVIDLVCCNDLV